MIFTLKAKGNQLDAYYNGSPSAAIPLQSLFEESSGDSSMEDAQESGDVEIEDLDENKGLAGITMVYWDYYHTVEQVYIDKINHHRTLGYDPWVAGGVWTWNRFYTALPFTMKATKACMSACRKSTVSNVFITLWGDDGNEFDFYSSLPGILYFALHCYHQTLPESPSQMCSDDQDPDEVPLSLLQHYFGSIFGGCWDDFVDASAIDCISDLKLNLPLTYFPPNASKWLLWQDSAY